MHRHKIYSKFTKVDGTRIHYLKCGSGKPLVILHASFSNAQTFSGLMKFFSHKYTVYVPDFPGYGKSDPIKNATFKSGAVRLIKWVDKMNLKDFVLCGVSMGGTNSIYFAQQIDQKISAYLLIEPYCGTAALPYDKKLVDRIKFVLTFFKRFVPEPLGNFIWNSRILLTVFIKIFDPLNEPRATDDKIKVLQACGYGTFWSILKNIFSLDLLKEKNLSHKPTTMLISQNDDTLNYEVTLNSFKGIFPNLEILDINLSNHYPLEPITERYIKTKYSFLFKNKKLNFH